MNAKPAVAVIIAAYNRWPLVTRAVESVLGQSYSATRCIVVDDASTDGTAEKLEEKYGDRITLIRQPVNREKSVARNRGLELSGEEYVCFLDSDDELMLDSVARRVEIFLRAPAFHGVAYGFCAGIGEPRAIKKFLVTPPEGDVLAVYLRTYFVHNNGIMLKRATLSELGAYQEMLTHREDRELLIRLAAQLEFRCTRSIVARNHRTPGSARFDYMKSGRQGMEMVRLLRADPRLVPRLAAHLNRVEQSECWEWLRCLYKNGDYHDFRQGIKANWSVFASSDYRPKLIRRYLASFVRQCLAGQKSAERQSACKVPGGG